METTTAKLRKSWLQLKADSSFNINPYHATMPPGMERDQYYGHGKRPVASNDLLNIRKQIFFIF